MVGDSGGHGYLADVQDLLRPVLSMTRPLAILCPHADDGAITAGCLLHEYAVRKGLPVVEILVFSGDRNVPAHWMKKDIKVEVREAEFSLECKVLGAETVCWRLDAYQARNYQPTPTDIDKVVSWFRSRTPGAIIVPPATDAHLGHRMTRALAAIGLLGAELRDVLVLSGWTPWGPLPKPNAYFTYDGEAERMREWAIRCHASQTQLTDYPNFCSHLGRAYAYLVREWAHGHSITGRGHERVEEQTLIGAELFQVERLEPGANPIHPSNHCDPLHWAMAILQGQIDPDRAFAAE